MKSASPSKRVSTRGKKTHRAIVRKQSEKDQMRQRIHDDVELAIEGEDVDAVETPPEKATSSGSRQYVTKAGRMPCKECKREKQRGDGLGFHFCPNDEMVVGFKANVGPIGRPSARGSDLDSGASEQTG
ncbi:hypothetical protein ACJRO7_026952 [Eucalyptus globulus]|uniref:Uncharacterized protein n=2 Tax=Eucalyptus globulus TaxID=34317 RepID=A0ABD3JR04_EUCGL